MRALHCSQHRLVSACDLGRRANGECGGAADRRCIRQCQVTARRVWRTMSALSCRTTAGFPVRSNRHTRSSSPRLPRVPFCHDGNSDNAPILRAAHGASQELITTLKDTKGKAVEMGLRIQEASATAAQIEALRARYKPAAKHGSVLYFVVAGLAGVCVTYEYSLGAFLAIFRSTLAETPQARRGGMGERRGRTQRAGRRG